MEFTKITISENEYPIRFDLTVLKEVYEKYANISDFEMELMGFEVVGKEESGENIIKKTKLPSISCILFVLPLMINSALDFLGYETVETSELIKQIDVNFMELAEIIRQEMMKCFKSSVKVKKKYIPIP